MLKHLRTTTSRKTIQTGFTIVELLIVIVIIGILAAITIVAYNGIQNRAKDTERTSEMKSLEKALALYYVDNSAYPTCANAPYVTGAAASGCSFSSLAASLVPKYISSIPTDPVNSGSYQYYYAVGYQKTGATTYSETLTNNYITGMKLVTITSPTYGGWGPTDLTYLSGSNY